MPTRPSESTIKRLFALCGNRCAYPGCPVPVVSEGSVTAEVAHIKARSPEGSRYDPAQSDAERHAFENLLLLCGVHHKFVDDDPEQYTVEFLRELKEQHEATGGPVPSLTDQVLRDLIASADVVVSDGVMVAADTVTQSQIAHSITNYFWAATPGRAVLDDTASADEVAEWARRLLLTHDIVPLRRAIERGATTFSERLRAVHVAGEPGTPPLDAESLRRTLDVMTVITTEAVEYAADDVIATGTTSFHRLYERAATERVLSEVLRAWSCGEVLRRVYVLGAACLRRERWADATRLAGQTVSCGGGDRAEPWAKHGLKYLANAHLNGKKDGLVTYTLDWLDGAPWFLSPFGADREQAVDGLCQFDFVQGAIAIRQSGSSRAAYPSFAAFEAARVEPLVARLVVDRSVQAQLLGPSEDADLADLLRAMADLAGRAAFHALGPWSGRVWRDRWVVGFLDEHRWPPVLGDVARALLAASARSSAAKTGGALMIQAADQGWFPPGLMGELRPAGFGTRDYRPAFEELAERGLLALRQAPTRDSYGSYALTDRGVALGTQLATG